MDSACSGFGGSGIGFGLEANSFNHILLTRDDGTCRAGTTADMHVWGFEASLCTFSWSQSRLLLLCAHILVAADSHFSSAWRHRPSIRQENSVGGHNQSHYVPTYDTVTLVAFDRSHMETGASVHTRK